MIVGLGSDHRGYKLKEDIKRYLTKKGLVVQDYGCHSDESVDYPDVGFRVASQVAKGKLDRGILLCSTCIGMSMVANKVRGVRAASCFSRRMAASSRRHNNSNVLALGADLISAERAHGIVDVWLKTDFDGGRHSRRLSKISRYEKSCTPK
jgi:RpiB/LacA/LacB family sugar-phosphate isomerase